MKSPQEERALGCVQHADGLGLVGTDTDLRLGPCRSSVALVKTGECHVGLVAMATEARLEWVEGEAAGEDWRQRLFTTAFEKLCCKGEQNVG